MTEKWLKVTQFCIKHINKLLSPAELAKRVEKVNIVFLFLFLDTHMAVRFIKHLMKKHMTPKEKF